jgi:hypothetical protein
MGSQMSLLRRTSVIQLSRSSGSETFERFSPPHVLFQRSHFRLQQPRQTGAGALQILRRLLAVLLVRTDGP